MSRRRAGATVLSLALLLGAAATPGARAGEPDDVARWVDPFIGTGGHGHTFPGPTLPFGMVQVGPDTRLTGWDGCSGYHHDDTVVYGFSHTHLSGTGCSDYGDVLLMPGVGEVRYRNGADGEPGYRATFAHDRERAEAGFYAVDLLDRGVRVELTATPRVGLHRYTFPAGAAHVVVDLTHRDAVLASALEVVGDREIRGYRRSRAWAEDQHVYFFARFSRPFTESAVLVDGAQAEGRRGEGTDVRGHVAFGDVAGSPVVVAVGISAVDEEGARRNLEAEAADLAFDAARARARAAWNDVLRKVEIEGASDADRRVFYTALYHAAIAPNLFQDVDGRYRGRDLAVHRAEGTTRYTVFSLWDTFRALHPLLTLLEPARTRDFVESFLGMHDEAGRLPVWELAGNETDCMIGNHAIPVIADAWAKGIRGFDGERALRAMVATASRDERGLRAYRTLGFVPAEEEGESVSKTLEYAYDDGCIALLARALGKEDVAREFALRAQSWRNLLDPASGFFVAKQNHRFVTPFDPAEVNLHYTEANAWQYAHFVPQDLDGLAQELDRLDARRTSSSSLGASLDVLFGAEARTTGREQADITGLIGQYAHGNEPSHHVAWLHAHAGEPWKTQARVREICSTLYSDRPDGLCGNEDCGQMSAWYVFAALGFYPVTPGLPEYVLGAPRFPEARLHLEDGRTFTIRAPGVGEHPYVVRATLNGKPHERTVLPHAAVVAGGELRFEMGPAPSTWGTAPDARPRSRVEGPRLVAVPFLLRGDRSFRKATEVRFGTLDPDATVHVSSDGGATFRPLDGPLRLEATTTLVAYAERGGERSRRVEAAFLERGHDATVALAHPWSPVYAATGDLALVDGLRGGPDWRTGDWQGFQGVDLVATVDLQEVRDVRAVRGGFLQDQRSWIWLPRAVEVLVSPDGETFAPLGSAVPGLPETADGVHRATLGVEAPARARYVRVVAKTMGACPPWHPSAGGAAWIFADEIEVVLGR